MFIDTKKKVLRCKDKLVEHKEYIKEYSDDLPEVKEWTWYKSMNK